MHLKRPVALAAALTLTLSLAACGGGSDSSSSSSSSSTKAAKYGDCKITSKKGSLKVKPANPGTLTVETTLPAQGWWNGTTPSSIKSGYEYCLAANLANMANLPITVYPGMRIGQLSFHTLTTPAEHPYGSGRLGSKYQGQAEPTPSRYYLNFEPGYKR